MNYDPYTLMAMEMVRVRRGVMNYDPYISAWIESGRVVEGV